MLGKICRWLVELFRRLYGLATPSLPDPNRHSVSSRRVGGMEKGAAKDLSYNGAVKTSRPLSDADFEYVFMQLLEGVAHGWSQGRILRFFEGLQERATEAQWIWWLSRFGERLLASPASNEVLAARMVQLGEQTQTIPSIRKIGEVAHDIGGQLLARQQNKVVWEYHRPDNDRTPLPDNLKAQQKAGTADYDAISSLDEENGLIWDDPATDSTPLPNNWEEQQRVDIPQLAADFNAISPLHEQKELVWEQSTADPHQEQQSLETPQIAADFDTVSSLNDLWDRMPQDGDLEEESDRQWPDSTADAQIITEQPIVPANAAPESALDLANAWFQQGIQLYEIGELLAAVTSFDKATAIKSDFAEAWNNRGIALSDLGAWEVAIASFDKATELKPDFYQAWNNRGAALFNLKRWQEAVASFNNATAIKLDFHEAWYNRGVALFNLGHLEEAIASYDKAIAIKPEKYEAWNNRGYVLQKLRSWQEALDSYNRAITIKPDFREAWENRGYVLQQLGRWDDALDSYDRAKKIQPEN